MYVSVIIYNCRDIYFFGKKYLEVNMKLAFLVYHDILEDRITKMLDDAKIDYYTQWEEVKGKGHQSDAHLGSRTFPGYNNVRMIAFDNEKSLVEIIKNLKELNNAAQRPDDKARLFSVPLEMIV